MADASIRLVHAEHLHLEQSLLRIPNEHVGRNVRPSQKMTARESDNCLSTLGRLAADLPAGRASADDALAALDALVAGLQGLRHRLETLNRRDRTQLERTGKRLAHLRAFHAIGDTADARYADWARTRLNRLLVDHLTREGYQRSARRLAEETGLLDLVDLDTFEACNSIAAKLAAGDHAAALAWCSLNKDALKKKGLTELEFQLRLQQYIEMVRRRDFVAARAHAAKFLDPASDGERGEVVRQAAAMLVFGPETDSQPYKTFFSTERTTYLCDLFVSTYQSLLFITPDSFLQIALTAGLTALKTQHCHDYIESGYKAARPGTLSWVTSLCPICSTELSEMARGLPFCLPMTSVVDPDPVALPNGRVYGMQRLEEYARKHACAGGEVQDPVTGQSFSRDALTKIYIV